MPDWIQRGRNARAQQGQGNTTDNLSGNGRGGGLQRAHTQSDGENGPLGRGRGVHGPRGRGRPGVPLGSSPGRGSPAQLRTSLFPLYLTHPQLCICDKPSIPLNSQLRMRIRMEPQRKGNALQTHLVGLQIGLFPLPAPLNHLLTNPSRESSITIQLPHCTMNLKLKARWD